LQRAFENRADRNEPEELVARNGRQARRRDAAALRAIGRAAILARRDLRRQVGREGHGRLREDAVVGRGWRLRIHLEQTLRQRELRELQPERHQVGDDALAVGGTKPLLRHFADLRRVEAVPDLFDFRPRGPELQELLEVAVAIYLL